MNPSSNFLYGLYDYYYAHFKLHFYAIFMSFILYYLIKELHGLLSFFITLFNAVIYRANLPSDLVYYLLTRIVIVIRYTLILKNSIQNLINCDVFVLKIIIY